MLQHEESAEKPAAVLLSTHPELAVQPNGIDLMVSKMNHLIRSSWRALALATALTPRLVAAPSVDLKLSPGQTFSCTMEGGTSVAFSFPLDSGEFIQFVFRDAGQHPQLQLFDTHGKVARQATGRTLGRTPFSYGPEQQGKYRLIVSAPPSHDPYSFQLEWVVKRPWEATDRHLILAEGALSEAASLRDRWIEEFSVRAVEQAMIGISRYERVNDRVEVLWGRLLLAEIYYRLVQDDLALRQIELVSTESDELRVPDLRVEAEVLRGLILARSGQMRSAVSAMEACRVALELSRSVDDRRGEADAYNCIGESYYESGDRTAAIENYLRAEDIWRELPLQRGAAETSLYLGQSFTNVGNLEKAEHFLQQALRSWEILRDRRGQALTRVSQGALAYTRSEQQEALDLLLGVRPIIRASGDYIWGAATESFLAGVHLDLGEHQTALEYSLAALKSFQATGLPSAIAEGHLAVGNMYRALNQNDTALEHFSKALAHARRGGGNRLIAWILQRTAQVQQTIGERAEAEKNYRLALRHQRSPEEDPVGRAQILNGLGRLHSASGDYDEATKLHQEALTLSRKAGYSLDVAESFYSLALVEKSRLNLKAATVQVERALKVVEQLRVKVDDPGFRASYFATVQDYYQLAIELTMLLDRREPAGGWAEKALHLSERARARSLLENLAWGDVDPGPEPQILPLTVTEIQSGLDDKTALLEYSLGSERSFLWVITRERLVTMELAREADIRERISRLYHALRARSSSTSAGQTARADRLVTALLIELGRMLLPPPEMSLDASRLVFIPDGPLYYLPFAALVPPAAQDMAGIKEDPRPLVLKAEIARLPSASAFSVLKDRRATARSERSVAVFADPVFESDDPRLGFHARGGAVSQPVKSAELQRALRDVRLDDRLPRLIASGREGRGIHRMAPAGTALLATGFEASKSLAVGRVLRNYPVLHFATHGLLNAERPDRSGLVLSLYDETGAVKDGFLSLSDIYQLDLPVDLVVLSACETGLGREVRGEGVMGLVRAFQNAGAQNVVASLWKVDDWATEDMMLHFYEALFQKEMGPAAALQEAQKAMLEQARWRAPFYWAAFVLEGDLRKPGWAKRVVR